MKQIIDGKRYDTEKATQVCWLRCSFEPGDFGHHETALYVTKKGSWFLSGRGGPMSMWAFPVGQSGYSGGAGIKPIESEEAQEILELADAQEALEKYFWFNLEDA